MGGQACVFYGAAEFSRDVDFAILADPVNLSRLTRALSDLQAQRIAVPAFEPKYLRRGHAVHFRCGDAEADGLRIDVMTKMRGVDAFEKLWRRRTTIELPGGPRCHLMSLPDLVQAKKTQRDKDWPMLRRLVEAHYFSNRDRPTARQVAFWLREMRTPELLVDVVGRSPQPARRLRRHRPLLRLAQPGHEAELAAALRGEEDAERAADVVYWAPLRAELDKLRHERSREARSRAR
jgi:hypothetical protein